MLLSFRCHCPSGQKRQFLHSLGRRATSGFRAKFPNSWVLWLLIYFKSITGQITYISGLNLPNSFNFWLRQLIAHFSPTLIPYQCWLQIVCTWVGLDIFWKLVLQAHQEFFGVYQPETRVLEWKTRIQWAMKFSVCEKKAFSHRQNSQKFIPSRGKIKW